MSAPYTLQQANSLLPLVRHISREIVERRTERKELIRLREDLETADTPEGIDTALANLESGIFEQREGIRGAIEELEGLGLHVLRLTPLTVHIPGETRQGPLVFCWQVGEQAVSHGHAVGEEEDHRRPLRVRASHETS